MSYCYTKNWSKRVALAFASLSVTHGDKPTTPHGTSEGICLKLSSCLYAVSKLFNTMSAVLLYRTYRTIHLVEPVDTVVCCKTLHAACSVRSSTIIWCVLVYNDLVHICSFQVRDSYTSHSGCSSASYVFLPRRPPYHPGIIWTN